MRIGAVTWSGEASNTADIAYGNHGSARGSASFVLPQWGDYRQSLSVDGQSLGFADKRESVSDGQMLYRGALDTGNGTLGIDVGLTVVRDVPPSPIIRDGTALTSLIPINANFNPADARIDQNQYHLALGYERPTALGQWSALASFTHSDITDVRAFLHPDLSGAADSQDQHRRIDDAYFDTHLTNQFAGDGSWVVGADVLYGLGKQSTLNGNSGYTVPLDGSVLPQRGTRTPWCGKRRSRRWRASTLRPRRP